MLKSNGKGTNLTLLVFMQQSPCPKKYSRAVNKVRHFRCPSLSVARGSFKKTIPKHDTAFLYCDPPYYLDDPSGKMFRGIYPQRNFPIHHNGFRHDVLRDLLYAHKGGFALSYNDCEIIRKWYGDFKVVELSWQYTLGQGETRIGKNRKNKWNGVCEKVSRTSHRQGGIAQWQRGR